MAFHLSAIHREERDLRYRENKKTRKGNVFSCIVEENNQKNAFFFLQYFPLSFSSSSLPFCYCFWFFFLTKSLLYTFWSCYFLFFFYFLISHFLFFRTNCLVLFRGVGPCGLYVFTGEVWGPRAVNLMQ